MELVVSLSVLKLGDAVFVPDIALVSGVEDELRSNLTFMVAKLFFAVQIVSNYEAIRLVGLYLDVNRVLNRFGILVYRSYSLAFRAGNYLDYA